MTKKHPKNTVEDRPEDAAADATAVDPSVELGANEPDTRTDTTEPAVDLSPAERQRDEFKDLLLRKTAEFDNYRKRTDRERQALSDTAPPASSRSCSRSWTTSSGR